MQKIKKHRLMLRRAQTALEYAMVIALVSGALISIQIYLKRGIQGRLRQAGDEIGEQYSPVSTTADSTIITNSTVTITQTPIPLVDQSGNEIRDPYNFNIHVYGIESETNSNETTIRKSGSYEKVGPFESSLF